jgi:outer membrane protein assembly factor BamB
VSVSVSTCLAVEPEAKKTQEGWPQWHGVNRDGKSLDTGLLKSWPKEGPKLLWKTTNMGQGYSSMSIGGGLIYTTGRKEKGDPGNPPSEKKGDIVDHRPGERLFMMGIDMDGKIKWSKDVGQAFNGNHVYTGSRATPTYDNGDLYLITGLGLLGRYDAKTGEAKWTRDIQKEFKPLKMRWAFTESILIVGDLLIVTPGAEDCFMAALNKKTGKTVWKSGGFGPAHYTSPIYVEYEGAAMIINGGGHGIVGIHAKTGKILWANNFAKGNMANVPTPSFVDGYVFWSVGYGKGSICLKLTVKGKRVKAAEAWRSKDIGTQYGGWVIHDGHIYGNCGYKWSCVELKTGKTIWQGKGVRKGSIAFADGMLYLYSMEKGQVILAPATTKGLKHTGEFNVSGRGWSRAHPVITGGRMYLRFDDNLYCFDVKAK